MFCEAYDKSLTNVAAGGEVLSPALQQHLVSCDACRVAFAEEQALFAAIDSGLRATVDPEVPSTLIPRVRVALNNEPVPQRHLFNSLVWGFAGTAVAASLVIGLLHLSPENSSVPAKFPRTSPIAVTENPSNPRALNPLHADGVSPLQHKNSVALVADHGSKRESPEVLVPDEERVAFAQFMTQASSGSASASVRAGVAPRAPQGPIQTAPVEIASLELKPLDQDAGR